MRLSLVVRSNVRRRPAGSDWFAMTGYDIGVKGLNH